VAAPRKHRRRRGAAPPESTEPEAGRAGGSAPEPSDPQAYRTAFSCPHCFRRLDRFELAPWFELLRCEWSGRDWLKVHDMKWDFALAALAPDTGRALLQATAAEREAAVARVRTVGERRVDAGAIADYLRERVAAGAIERVEPAEFAYVAHPRAVAWLALPALAAALVAALLLSPLLAVPATVAVAALVLRPLIGRLLRRPFRLTIAGSSLELALAGRIVSWPLAEVGCRLTPPRTVMRLYLRAGPAVLRHGEVEVVVHPDLPRFREFVRRLRAGGAVIR
jgi:hypothetical protein